MTVESRWSVFGDALVRVRSLLSMQRDARGPAAHVSHGDQVVAGMRDYAAELGVDLDDERTVFVLLCGVALVSRCALSGHLLCPDVLAAVTSATSNLEPFTPDSMFPAA